jgi:hydroxyquinol 1,2-dioxygenase
MRDFDETSITSAVLGTLGNGATPRVREVGAALVRHLHDLVRELEPTQDEWAQAIAFLTRTGRMCSETRQEFILLSDVLGVSMLVDAINQRRPGRATQTTVLGPFYVDRPPELPLGSDISAGRPGEPMLVEGSVRRLDGTPAAGAIVDTWQSDADGLYDVQRPGGLDRPGLRARFRADGSGAFRFRSIVPSFYPIPDDGPVGELLKLQGRHPYRPAHVHFMISAPGCETLVTHVFVAGDRYLDSDVVFGVKDALVASLEPQPAGVGTHGDRADGPMRALRYDFVLADAPPAHA